MKIWWQIDPTQQVWWSSPDEKAIINFRNGNMYEGSISMRCMHGEGRYQWKNGTVYLVRLNCHLFVVFQIVLKSGKIIPIMQLTYIFSLNLRTKSHVGKIEKIQKRCIRISLCLKTCCENFARHVTPQEKVGVSRPIFAWGAARAEVVSVDEYRPQVTLRHLGCSASCGDAGGRRREATSFYLYFVSHSFTTRYHASP